MIENEKKDYIPIKILHDCVSRFEQFEIPYMLTGSMAMMNYSVFRFTADIDIVVEIVLQDADKIIKAFTDGYYVSVNSAKWAIKEKRMFNVIHQESAFKIDCIIKKSDEYYQNAFENRKNTDYYGKELWIIEKNDLIISKLHFAEDNRSEKQLTDVKNLLKSGFDRKYIEKWTKELDVFDLFKICEKEISE